MADDVLLEKIANHYLFYGSFHSDLGLYNGKMGMVIFGSSDISSDTAIV